MKLIEAMNYREWQKRNTEHFNKLTKNQRKKARQQGYSNVGWQNVQKSWNIVLKIDTPPPNLFEYKLRKGDIIGAIGLSILEAERAKHQAQTAIKSLNKNQQYFDQLADEALAKYPLL